MSNNQHVEVELDKVNKKLDLLIVILLVNSGMKLPDIAQTLGVSVRTIQRMVPIAKMKYGKGRKSQSLFEESLETATEAEPQSKTASE